MKYLKTILIALFLFGILSSYSQDLTKVRGQVIDANTKESIPFTTVFAKESNKGVNCDIDGNFVIELTSLPDTLVISGVGYSVLYFPIHKIHADKLIIQMSESVIEMSEFSVIVYQDPGKHIMEMVVDKKKKNDLFNSQNVIFNEYRKNEVDILNISPANNNGYFGRTASVFNSFSKDTNENVAPLYFKERYIKVFHSSNLQTHEEHEIASKKLDLKTDDLARRLDQFDFKINIYDGVIPILKTSFIGPASKIGILYYKFIPLDTLMIGGKEVYLLSVVPKTRNENTLYGKIWIESKSFSIVQYDLYTSKGSNINFINQIHLKQTFSLDTVLSSSWTPESTNTIIDFGSGLELLGIPVQTDSSSKTLRLSISSLFANYEVNSDKLTVNNFYYSDGDTSSNLSNTNLFKESYRIGKLSQREKAIYQSVDSLKRDKNFIRKTKLSTFVFSGYWDFNNKLRIGPYSSLFSSNSKEGVRIRTGFWTLPDVSKTINVNGYMAYGTKDKKFKGGIGFKFLPNTKRYTKTSLFIGSDYDALGKFDDALDKDNLLTLGLRKNVPASQVFIKQIKLMQEIELNQNWSSKSYLAIKKIRPTFNFGRFKEKSFENKHRIKADELTVNELGISLRYGHNERTTVFNYDKIRIYSAFPVFKLNYVYGFKGTKKALHTYHKISANVSQEVVLPIKGSLYYSLTAGKLFGKVPALLLFTPRGNAFYISNRYTFNNMLPYEYVADKYASLMLTYNMGGLILNKIPLINKLKLRERVLFNNYVGSVSQSNLLYNSLDKKNQGGLKTYSEVGVGIGNILNVLAIDAVWRISEHNNQPKTNFGIYTSIKLMF